MTHEPIHITALQLENVKRVRAVALSPAPDGLTIIGGNNGQGKTSILDAIAWALGGERYRPSDPQRDGSVLPPHISITLSNGLIVERKGKNSALTVTDPEKRRFGQRLLDEFVSTFAIDLPRFLQAGDREKADALLQVLGIGDQLATLDTQISSLYERRRAQNAVAAARKAAAEAIPFDPTAPAAPISIADLIRQRQDAVDHNAQNASKRAEKARLEQSVRNMSEKLEALQAALTLERERLAEASAAADDLCDVDIAPIEDAILSAEELNRSVMSNAMRRQADEDYRAAAEAASALDTELSQLRKERIALLTGAPLPLPGLTVEDGRLLYKGHPWDCLSGSEQLIVGAAIARALNPQCGFVLLDGLEAFDPMTLDAFGQWLHEHNLQAIATRVSTGSECTIIIEDGEVLEDRPHSPALPLGELAPQATERVPSWKAGEF